MKKVYNLFDFSQQVNYKNEILAGLTVAMTMIPESLSFAILAGFPPLMGLYAAFIAGQFKGKRVEATAETINRVGLIFSTSKLSSTLQYNYVGDAYGDPSNVMTSEDPIAGLHSFVYSMGLERIV